MKNNWVSLKEHFNKWFPKVCSIIAIMLFFGLLTCIIIHLFKPYLAKSIFSNYFIAEQQDYNSKNPNGLTVKDRANLRSLMNKGKIVSIDSIYDKTLDYYDSLITILVALLGLFAFVSYFSMRGKLKGEAEECVREIMNSNYFKTILDCEMRKIIQENLPDYVSETIGEDEVKRLISQEYELNSDKIKEDILESLNTKLKSKEQS